MGSSRELFNELRQKEIIEKYARAKRIQNQSEQVWQYYGGEGFRQDRRELLSRVAERANISEKEKV
jgi:hypothetical protein